MWVRGEPPARAMGARGRGLAAVLGATEPVVLLMTGHEIGGALGVAVLSAVATGAGSLTTGATDNPGRPPARFTCAPG